LEFGGIGTIGEQSEYGEGEQGVWGIGLSLFGAGIGHFFKAFDEKFEGIGRKKGHGNLRVKGKKRAKPFRLL
jgi:hypothetical protein